MKVGTLFLSFFSPLSLSAGIALFALALLSAGPASGTTELPEERVVAPAAEDEDKLLLSPGSVTVMRPVADRKSVV